jgi:phage terminase large subunit GpA-like protein
MATAISCQAAPFGMALLPDPELNVSEWADEYRVLSRVSAGEPGRCPSRTSNL